ncbi:MAG TPA: GNAT family protein [Jatrophihabitans sp.]|nr:GNAT family protein [Jatrophihabitans sp.]
MIEGKLVRLRPFTPADYPRMLEFKNDIELELLGGGLPPRPRTLAGLTEFFDRMTKGEQQVTFAIEADGKLIGDCGLFDFDNRSGIAELGIGIGDRDYWGRGYGREAVTLLVDYGFRMHNLRKICLKVFGSNERAIRSYQAAGFVEEGRQRAHRWSGGRYEDDVHMAIFRDPPS